MDFPRLTFPLIVDFGRANGFHFHLLHLGRDTIVCGVTGDEPFLHGPFKGAAKHEMDALD